MAEKCAFYKSLEQKQKPKNKKKATFWKYRIQWNRNMHNCVLHLNIYYKLTN